MFLKCWICGWRYLPESVALVPPISVITENYKIALGDINLEAQALCRRCAKRASKDCPQARFYRLVNTRREIARRIAAEAEAARLQAEKLEAERREAEKFRRTGCWTSVPLLPTVEIKTVDKNGRRLRGAVEQFQVRRALEPIYATQEFGAEQRKAARRARLAAEKEERELKAARAARMTKEALGLSA